MTRRALLLLAFLLLTVAPLALAAQTFSAFLPLSARMRHAALGLEAVPGAMAAHVANLGAIGPDWTVALRFRGYHG